MKYAIGYLRVSTREQGRSGVGLAAQRTDIDAFGAREGFAVKNWHQDIQTGAGRDALLLRPGLAAALKEARATRCALIVSRLDRLSRNVHFITGLMEHKVHFIVAALGRDCDDFTLHIYASLAEQERKMISERCKSAAAAMKLKGVKFGMARRSKAWQRNVSARGRAAWVKVTNEWSEAHRLHIEWVFRQPGADGRPISYRAAAAKLNEQNIESPMRKGWTGHQLSRTAHRLGLRHPTGYIRLEVARARVLAIWQEDPNCTTEQVISRLGLEHPLGYVRAWRLLHECRLAAASRSPSRCRIGWNVDRWTATRILIGKIMKRHPRYTGRQVIEALGPNHTARIQWVWKVMSEFRGGTAKVVQNRRSNRRWYFAKRRRLQRQKPKPV